MRVRQIPTGSFATGMQAEDIAVATEVIWQRYREPAYRVQCVNWCITTTLVWNAEVETQTYADSYSDCLVV